MWWWFLWLNVLYILINGNTISMKKDSLIQWIWKGGLTSTSIRFHVHLNRSMNHEEIPLNMIVQSTSSSSYIQPYLSMTSSFIQKFYISSLPYPNELYTYKLIHPTTYQIYHQGTFTTASQEEEPYNFTFSLSSCQDEDSNPLVYIMIN